MSGNSGYGHYVPRCYLKNFTINDSEKIFVFDKYKMEKRIQKITEVAMENYFYDVKLLDYYKQVDEETQKKIYEELRTFTDIKDIRDIETFLELIDNEQPIEKGFFSNLEGIYSKLISTLIGNSYEGNQWVINNCNTMSNDDKYMFSLFSAIQIIRTKSFRDKTQDLIKKLYESIVKKVSSEVEDDIEGKIKIDVNKEYVKLLHADYILDPEMASSFAEVLSKHKWITYANKTGIPFYTSDNPVVNIPHRHDTIRSYGGLNSEGIEIAFPLSPYLLLAMYDYKVYEVIPDRTFMVIDKEKDIEYYNRAQVVSSNRFLYSIDNNFDLANEFCKRNPKYQKYRSGIEILN